MVMSLNTGELGPLLGVAPLTHTFGIFLGILGTFALRRLAAQGEGRARAAS